MVEISLEKKERRRERKGEGKGREGWKEGRMRGKGKRINESAKDTKLMIEKFMQNLATFSCFKLGRKKDIQKRIIRKVKRKDETEKGKEKMSSRI